MESPEETLKTQGRLMLVDKPHFRLMTVLEGVGRSGWHTDSFTRRNLPPLIADADIKKPGMHSVTLFGVRMDVQRRTRKARSKHIDGLEQLPSGVRCCLGDLPPHADRCEIQNTPLACWLHVGSTFSTGDEGTTPVPVPVAIRKIT